MTSSIRDRLIDIKTHLDQAIERSRWDIGELKYDLVPVQEELEALIEEVSQ